MMQFQKIGVRLVLFFSFYLWCFGVFSAYGDTPISGNIYVSTTWTAAGSPYIVTGDIRVYSTTSQYIPVLTIQPGVTVKFNSGSSLLIGGTNTTQRGGLIASGTRFTSNAVSPAAGDWDYIYFTGYSVSTLCSLTNCLIEYGGGASSNALWGMIQCDSVSPTISNCTVQYSKNQGILCTDYTGAQPVPQISNTQFRYNRRYPLSLTPESVRGIGNGCLFTGNTTQAIEVRSGTLITSCTWQQLTVPYVVSGNFSVYAASTGISILTLNPGVIMKFKSGQQLTIGLNSTRRGGLIARGNIAGGQIYFTSFADDSAGGDTNGDDTTTSPAPGDWQDLYLNNYSIATIERCTIRYGGNGSSGNIMINSSSVSITTTIVAYSDVIGIYCGTEDYPTITGCSFLNNQDYPLSLCAEGVRKVTNCTFTNNKRQGIEVRNDTVVTSCTWRNQGIPYVISGDVVVYTSSPGCMLNIESGCILKFDGAYTELDIAGGSPTQIGGLNATGVIFTSLKDDSVGGDTYGDGTATSPSSGDWWDIYFNNYTISSTKLVQCIIRYGGYSNNGMLYIDGCAPTFSFCTIGYSENHGIYASTLGYPTISTCKFEYNDDFPISALPDGVRKIVGNSFSNNVRQGIEIRDGLAFTSGTWTNQGVPYVINENVSVYSSGNGCILTLSPGVVIKFYDIYSQLNIGGTDTTKKGGLIATGVYFTSLKDDSAGGDTYGDGTATTPAPGNWECLNFGQYTLSTTKLDKCVIRYGSYSYSGELYVNGCVPTFSYCTINYSKEHGIYGLSSGYPTVSNCRFENNQDFPVSIEAEGIRKVTGSSFSGNKRPGIEAKTDIVTTSGTWTNQGVPYVINVNVSVYTSGNGCILTLSPGVVIKFYDIYSQLNIGGSDTTKKGGLLASGVHFTSLKDDAIGGDTYGDGTATSASPGDWDTLNFAKYTLSTTKLDRCIVRYGSYSYSGELYVNGCAPTFSYCTIDYSDKHGIYGLSNGYPMVSNCRFQNNQDYPVSIEAEGIRKVAGCSFGNNKRQGIEAKADIVIASGTWTNQGIPYVINGTVSIHTSGGGDTLTLNSGVIIKFADTYSELEVGDPHTDEFGGLIAVGNVYAPIYFTSIKDDSIGGDTYGDGTATSPAPGDWNWIYTSYFTLPSSVFDHCIVRYADYGIYNASQAQLKVRYCLIKKNSYCGIYSFNPIGGEMHHNTIINNNQAGMYMQSGNPPLIANNNLCQNPIGLLAHDSYVEFTHNNISKNTTFGAQNTVTSYTIPGEFNWWGDTTGPYDGSTIGLYNPEGHGDTVSNYIDYDPWLRENPEQPRRLPDIKLIKATEVPALFDLDQYIFDSAASWTWATNPAVDQARLEIHDDHAVDYQLPRTINYLGIDSVTFTADWYAASTSLLKYSTYLLKRLPDAVVDNGRKMLNCDINLQSYLSKDTGIGYPSSYTYETKYANSSDTGKLTISFSGSTIRISPKSALTGSAKVIVGASPGAVNDWDKEIIHVSEVADTYGELSSASDTSHYWYQLPVVGASSLPIISWVSSIGGRSGVLQLNFTTATQGVKIVYNQELDIEPGAWYGMRCVFASSAGAGNQHLVSGQLFVVDTVSGTSEVGSFLRQSGQLRDTTWWVQYGYVHNTGITMKRMRPMLVVKNNRSSGSVYVDSILLYKSEPLAEQSYGALEQAAIPNGKFDSGLSGWFYSYPAMGIEPGAPLPGYSVVSSFSGQGNVLQLTFTQVKQGLKLTSDPVVNILPMKSTRLTWKVYGVANNPNRSVSGRIYCIDTATGGVLSDVLGPSGVNVSMPSGQWVSYTAAGSPVVNSETQARVQLVIKNGNTASDTVYLDDIILEQENDSPYYWDHSLF